MGQESFYTELVCRLRLCDQQTVLCLQMDRLQQLNKQHLQPVIKQLQEPKKAILSRQIHRRDVDRLIRLKDLMGPFIQDFSRTAHALRHQAFKVFTLSTAEYLMYASPCRGILQSLEISSACCALQ